MKTVRNGKEKQQAYAHSFQMLSKALKYEFNLEAIAISYAIIEDRLVSFLHHAGIVTREKGDLKINRKLYPYMRELLEIPDDYLIKIKDISVKLSLIRSLLAMSMDRAAEIDKIIYDKFQNKEIRTKPLTGYMELLVTQIDNTVDRSSITSTFDGIDRWRLDRNQLIHALLSKTVESSDTAKKECAEVGCMLARSVDNNLVKKFKKNNTIRKRFNIQ